MPLRLLKGEGLWSRSGAAQDPAQVLRLDVLDQTEAVGAGTFWATDADGCLTYLSAHACEALGAHGQAIVGRDFTSVFSDEGPGGAEQSQRTIGLRMRSRSRIDNHVMRMELKPDGAGAPAVARWWRMSGRPCFDERGGFRGYRGTAVDITSDHESNRENAEQSLRDPLTGLANRRRMGQRLTGLLSNYKVAGRSCALMMLDLDRFKAVNDTLGHLAGDELLKQVARRLEAIVKDKGEIGRLGGDEFQIILPDIDDRGVLADLGNRLIQMISQPYTIDGRRVIIGTSVGAAIAPYDGIEVQELVSAADMALYAAKGGGRGVIRFFSSDLRDAASRGQRIEDDLRDALAAGELELHYQPLVSPHDNSVRGFEALMRWHPPESDPIPPSLFIPIAEQSDLIIKLGDWAMRQACVHAAEWPGNLRVAVNVSAKQFMNEDFPKSVAIALERSGLAPGRLDLEITESVFVGDVEAVDKMFVALKKLGVKLTMDDFGTGYSSLGYLQRAPFDKIKIDQSFVRGCTKGGNTNPAIISAIVSLARALGMETVAEGVEAMDELNLVRERGADLVQGYIYSRPLTQQAIMGRLADGNHGFVPSGPARYRADRKSVFRKIGLIHEDHYYTVTLRNISRTGAWIEGLGGVPVGAEFVLDLGGGQLVVSKVMRSTESAQGVKFEFELMGDGNGDLMTRHRVSPYALASAGMPLAALPSSSQSVAHRIARTSGPGQFIQLDV